MDERPRSCTYDVTGSVAPGKRGGTIHLTRMETILYLKTKIPSLSAVDDGRFSFTIDGVEVDDEPGVWADYVGDLPVKPIPTIHLRVLDELVEAKEESGFNAQTADLLVHFEYESPSETEHTGYEPVVQPDQQTRAVLGLAARRFGRDVTDLIFSHDGRILQGDESFAEAGVVAGARIFATDKDGRDPINAVAGSSTGPGTQLASRNSSVGGEAEAAVDCDPPAVSPPCPSAPTDNSTADQHPTPGPPARQPSPAAPMLALAPTSPADRSGAADDEQALRPAPPASQAPPGASSKRGLDSDEDDPGRDSAAQPPVKKKVKVAEPSEWQNVWQNEWRAAVSVEVLELHNRPVDAGISLIFDMLTSRARGAHRQRKFSYFIGRDDVFEPVLNLIAELCDPKAYLHYHPTTPQRLVYVYQGRPLSPQDTPRSLGMETDALIFGVDQDMATRAAITVLTPSPMVVSFRLTSGPKWGGLRIWPSTGTEGWGKSLDWYGTVVHSKRFYWSAGHPRWTSLTPYKLYPNTVVISLAEAPEYVDNCLKALGLPDDHRMVFMHGWTRRAFIWAATDYIRLHFEPQSSRPNKSTKLELVPAASVETKIFLVWAHLSAPAASNPEWDAAKSRAEKKDYEMWRKVVGVPSRKRQEDKSLMRVFECWDYQLERR